MDSTLLVSSGLLSHNVIVPLLRAPDERTKIRIARAGVLVFGLAAYGLALHAEGVFALVDQASALGGAGALVTVAFALFTKVGGAKTATATLVGGVAAYVAAFVIGLPYPFLTSLAVSVVVYLGGAALDVVAARARLHV